jgi:uncharacterized ParB-like nuclease family protein
MNKVMNINALVLDAKLQSRTEIDEATVADYADNIKMGDDFPPVLVYFDGINYYLTDGYHRYHAHKRAEKVSILCEVVNGTFRDAVLQATGVNSKHGMRRTHADKRKAVMTLLDDFEWSGWSNAEIARQCGVSPTFVANLRDSGGPAEVKYKTSGGNIATKAKAPGRVAKEPELKEPAKQEPQPEPFVESYDPRDELIEHLTKENDELTTNLALAHMGGTEQEQGEAREIINTLREEVRVLKIELVAVKQSRDTFQQENSQLKQQCASYVRQLKKQQ